MSLEEFTSSESSEGGTQSAEVSEKFKEAIKKASWWIKRTQKDEKKAKKHDMLLAGFLVKIIIDKKYDITLESLFICLHKWYTSNLLLGILSLINIEISNKIKETSKKERIKFDYYNQETIIFDDHNIDDKIRNRINSWIEDIIDIISIDYSNIKMEELCKLIYKDDDLLTNFTSTVFTFFLTEINVSIWKQKSYNISKFIISEMKKEMRKLKISKI